MFKKFEEAIESASGRALNVTVLEYCGGEVHFYAATRTDVSTRAHLYDIAAQTGDAGSALSTSNFFTEQMKLKRGARVRRPARVPCLP